MFLEKRKKEILFLPLSYFISLACFITGEKLTCLLEISSKPCIYITKYPDLQNQGKQGTLRYFNGIFVALFELIWTLWLKKSLINIIPSLKPEYLASGWAWLIEQRALEYAKVVIFSGPTQLLLNSSFMNTRHQDIMCISYLAGVSPLPVIILREQHSEVKLSLYVWISSASHCVPGSVFSACHFLLTTQN